MVIERTLIIIAVVWATGFFRDTRRRSFAYSLPIPITAVLVGTGQEVRAQHLLGVVLLVLFFRVAAFLRNRSRIGLIAVVLAATTFYVLAAIAVANAYEPAFWICFAGCLSVNVAVIWWERAATSGEVIDSDVFSTFRFATISVATILAALIGNLLGPLVVTFPYSGIPLLVDARKGFDGLARGVTRNAPGLLAFFAAVFATQESFSRPVSVALGWVAFLVIAVLANRLVPRSDDGRG